MIRPLLAFALAASIAPVVSAQTEPPTQGTAAPPELVAYPDLALVNGKVLTVDAQFTIAEAVAVRDGRILAVGTNAEIRRLDRTQNADDRSRRPQRRARASSTAMATTRLPAAISTRTRWSTARFGTQVRDDSVPAMLKQVRRSSRRPLPGARSSSAWPTNVAEDLSKLTAKDLDAHRARTIR